MLALVHKGQPRQRAYEMVQRSAMRAFQGEGRFLNFLKEDAELAALLTPAEVDECFNLEHALRYASALVKRAIDA
jgi:adenylosuccinate lyase